MRVRKVRRVREVQVREVLGGTLALLTAAGILVGTPLRAQGPPPQTAAGAVVFKGRAPVSDTLLEVKLPRPQEADLPNGLHVMVLEDRRAPQVSIQLSMRGAGGYYDPADHAGLAQFTAANLREGTVTRSSTAIAEQLDRLSGTLTVSTVMSSEDATIAASSLTEHVDVVLDLLADVLLNPTFPEQEFARYKAQTRAQLTQQRAQANFLAIERFSVVLAGDHPDGRISPTLAALEKTTRGDLVAFHRARYVPDHAVMAISGDISMADAMTRIQARLAKWQKTGAPTPTVADPAPLTKSGIFLVERPSSVQTNLLVGVQAIRRTDPDFFALTVLNKVIGGGPTGRLFRHLREERAIPTAPAPASMRRAFAGCGSPTPRCAPKSPNRRSRTCSTSCARCARRRCRPRSLPTRSDRSWRRSRSRSSRRRPC